MNKHKCLVSTREEFIDEPLEGHHLSAPIDYLQVYNWLARLPVKGPIEWEWV